MEEQCDVSFVFPNLSFKGFLDLKLSVNTTLNCYLRE